MVTNGVRKMKKGSVLRKLLIFLLIGFVILPVFGVANTKIAKYRISEEEQAIIDKFKDKEIVVGYITGYGEVLTEHVLQMMESDLELTVKSVEYPDYHSLYTAVQSGDVDIASAIPRKNDDSIYYSNSFFRDYRIIVTPTDSSIADISDLAYLPVGFIEDDVNYKLTASTIEKLDIIPVMYHSSQEVSQALINGEIKAYIGSSMEKNFVIENPDIIAKTALLDNPTGLKFATNNEEIQPLIETMANVVGDLSDKVRGEALQKKLDSYEDELIQNYLQTYYPGITEDIFIEVGAVKKSYPFSYVDQDGNYAGNYIEFLNYLKEKIDLEYTIANQDNAELTYDDLIEQLNNNEIHMMLGSFEYDEFPNITSIPILKSDDYLISIQSDDFKGHEFSSLDNMKIGLTADNVNFATSESYDNIQIYEGSSEVIDGLLNNEFDILLTKQSVYDYYQRIEYYNNLHQNNSIYKEFPFEVLVNSQNKELNSLIEDMYSIYTTFTVGELVDNPTLTTSEFINSYLEVFKTKNKLLYVIIAISVAFVILLGIVFILIQERRKKEMADILQKHQLDDLTGIWNRYIYKEKCLELMDRYANELGAFIYLS